MCDDLIRQVSYRVKKVGVPGGSEIRFIIFDIVSSHYIYRADFRVSFGV